MRGKLLLSLVMMISSSSLLCGYCASERAVSECLVSSFRDDYEPITDLPTIFIDTENGVGVTSKEEYVNAVVTVRGAVNDEDNITEVAAEIKGRGNSTWGMDKKPYRLKFNEKIKLLGNVAKEKNWVLLANYADKTLMRNALAFDTARKFFNFQFVPSVTFVDVVLDGVNIGSYMLTDQVEVKSKRVDVMEQETTVLASDPEITGGYLVEVDGFADREISWFKTAHQMKVTIKYPKDDEINMSQKNYIATYTQRMENALFSSQFDDEEKGWRKYVDDVSWVDWYIACELFGNSDSWWSTYMYKERDEKFKFGPLWDFDIAFNNDYRIGDATEKYMRESACEPKTWITRWWEDESLHEAVKVRWREIVAGGLRSFMTDYIVSTAAYLEESQKNNYEIWPTLNQRVHYEYDVRGSYDAEVYSLKKYVNSRISFLDSAWGVPAATDMLKVCDKKMLIAPNPVVQGDVIKMVFEEAVVGDVLVVSAVSLDGKVVYTSRMSVDANRAIAIDSEHIGTGIYIVVVEASNGDMFRGRLIVR